MYCKKCGKEVEGSEALCPFCGSPLDIENPVDEQPVPDETESAEEAAFRFVFPEESELDDEEETSEESAPEENSSNDEDASSSTEETSEEAPAESPESDDMEDLKEMMEDAESDEDTEDVDEDEDNDNEDDEDDDDEEYEKKPRNIKRILIVILVLVLAAGAVAGYQYWSYKSSEVEKAYKESDFNKSEVTLTITGTYENRNIFSDKDKTAALVRETIADSLNKESKCVKVSRLEFVSEFAAANVYYYYGQIKVKDMDQFKKQLDDPSLAKSWEAEDPIYFTVQASPSPNNDKLNLTATIINDNHK